MKTFHRSSASQVCEARRNSATGKASEEPGAAAASLNLPQNPKLQVRRPGGSRSGTSSGEWAAEGEKLTARAAMETKGTPDSFSLGGSHGG